jgi:hypothetical protein
MELWLRYRKGENLEYDKKVSVSSQDEWKDLIYDPELISSILWPDKDLFEIKSKHVSRKHYHEVDYENDDERNLSFLTGCREIAAQMNREFAGSRCLIYAPMRGALPIWRGISQFIENIDTQVYYPVTSSFISFPEEFGILGRRGRPASGRYNNRFEIERILPFLEDFDYFVYVDEIVSGGMMRGHLKDFARIELNNQIPVVAVGLADAFGGRSKSARAAFEDMSASGIIESFIWSGCDSLITEDQKFLLGAHYVDYQLGPHIVPLLDDKLEFYPEKIEFDKFTYKFFQEKGIAPDPFMAE